MSTPSEGSAHDAPDLTWAERFDRSAVRAAFASHRELRAATKQLTGLRTSQRLEDLRLATGLAGYVVDSDPHDDTHVVIRGPPGSLWEGAPFNARVLRAAGAKLQGRIEVTWSLDEEVCRTVAISADEGLDPIVLDEVRVSAPAVERIEPRTLGVTVSTSAGSYEAAAVVMVVPESLQVLGHKLRVFITGLSAPDQIGTLANAIAELGCTVLTAPTRTAAVIAVGGGPYALTQVQQGMPGLVLAEAHDTDFLPARPRAEDPGADVVDWLRPDVLAGIPLDPLMGSAFAPIAARRAIPALAGLDHEDVLMGTFRGALGDEAALTAQARYGDGKAVVTTLRLAESGRSDPLGQALLVALLRYVTADECEPRTFVEAPTMRTGVSEGT